MIRRLDCLWFRLLATGYRWIVRRVHAHHRREMMRDLGRHLASQKAHLN